LTGHLLRALRPTLERFDLAVEPADFAVIALEVCDLPLELQFGNVLDQLVVSSVVFAARRRMPGCPSSQLGRSLLERPDAIPDLAIAALDFLKAAKLRHI
jgi:hypothetical protein